jgi:hypothetical protein
MNNKEVVLECRKTKIELEHELLMKEMEVALIAMAGLPITAITLILQFQVWRDTTLMVLSIMFLAIGIVLLDDLRSDRKDKIIAKQKELDALILELTNANP